MAGRPTVRHPFHLNLFGVLGQALTFPQPQAATAPDRSRPPNAGSRAVFSRFQPSLTGRLMVAVMALVVAGHRGSFASVGCGVHSVAGKATTVWEPIRRESHGFFR
jgi:hypothetical protein